MPLAQHILRAMTLRWQIDGKRVQNASPAVAFSMSAAAAAAARGSWQINLVEMREAWSLTEHPREELPHGLRCFCPFSPSPAGYNVNRDSAFFLLVFSVSSLIMMCMEVKSFILWFYGSVGIEPKASHTQGKLYHWAVPSSPTYGVL